MTFESYKVINRALRFSKNMPDSFRSAKALPMIDECQMKKWRILKFSAIVLQLFYSYRSSTVISERGDKAKLTPRKKPSVEYRIFYFVKKSYTNQLYNHSRATVQNASTGFFLQTGRGGAGRGRAGHNEQRAQNTEGRNGRSEWAPLLPKCSGARLPREIEAVALRGENAPRGRKRQEGGGAKFLGGGRAAAKGREASAQVTWYAAGLRRRHGRAGGDELRSQGRWKLKERQESSSCFRKFDVCDHFVANRSWFESL